MGGRLDSTNIIDPVVSIITNIGLDHTEYLGNTLARIAKEKAGIIKEGIPVVIGDKNRQTRRIFEEIAAERSSQVFFANDFFQVPYSIVTPEGRHYFQVMRGKNTVFPGLWSDQLSLAQRRNLPVVLEVLELLRRKGWKITDEMIYEGLSQVSGITGFRGRWEVVSRQPTMAFDTGHNVDGIRQVVSQIENTRFDRLHLVYGAVNDKDIDHILQVLPKKAQYYFTMATIPRALDVKLLAAKAAFYGLSGTIHDTVPKALEAARKAARPDDLVVVTGSTFVVADAMVGG
jgi:dihydrofolate synthase/folylpolyglutamate synthase